MEKLVSTFLCKFLPGHGVVYATAIKFLFVYVINDILFLFQFEVTWRIWLIEWAHDVDLIMFPWSISFVDIKHIIGIINAENGIGCIPMQFKKRIPKFF